MNSQDDSIRLLFEGFMNNSPALNFIKDEAGVYVYANRAFSRTGGLRPEEMIGRDDFGIYPPDIATVFRDNDRLALAADCALEFTESTMINGSEQIWHVIKFPIHMPDGTTLVAGNAVDITARIRAEESARTSEERFRLTARATNDLVYDWDFESGSIWWNENLAIRFGYWREGRTHDATWWRSTAIHEGDRARISASLSDSITRRSATWSSEYRLRRADGRDAWVLDRGHLLYDRDGVAVRMIGALIDLTERARAESDLREANDRLEARVAERTAELARAVSSLESAHRAQKRFVADASHDLRTPLTVIRAEVDRLLAEQGDASRARESLERVAGEARRLEKLASDLLALATLDSETTSVRSESARLDEIVLEGISSLTPLAREKAIVWKIDIEDAVEMQCDENALRRAIANVLDNALKYSNEGGVIAVRFRRDASSAIVTVRDEGIGIAPDELPRLFDRFYRSDAARSTEGAGLGLPIVKSIVDAHGGTIDIASRQGGGTTVSIVLPISSVG